MTPFVRLLAMMMIVGAVAGCLATSEWPKPVPVPAPAAAPAATAAEPTETYLSVSALLPRGVAPTGMGGMYGMFLMRLSAAHKDEICRIFFQYVPPRILTTGRAARVVRPTYWPLALRRNEIPTRATCTRLVQDGTYDYDRAGRLMNRLGYRKSSGPILAVWSISRPKGIALDLSPARTPSDVVSVLQSWNALMVDEHPTWDDIWVDASVDKLRISLRDAVGYLPVLFRVIEMAGPGGPPNHTDFWSGRPLPPIRPQRWLFSGR